MKKKPIVAFLYDFDKTLCTTDMQDYAFIPSLGYTPKEFWQIANNFGWSNHMDGLLAYMYTMIDECRRKGGRLDREHLVRCGYDASPSGDLSAYGDAAGVSAWALDATRWAVGVGLINGTTDDSGSVVLDPQGSATRAQLAAILQRFCENVKK